METAPVPASALDTSSWRWVGAPPAMPLHPTGTFRASGPCTLHSALCRLVCSARHNIPKYEVNVLSPCLRSRSQVSLSLRSPPAPLTPPRSAATNFDPTLSFWVQSPHTPARSRLS
jgi:hypothetical protein